MYIIIIIIIINKSGNVIFFCGTGRHTNDACMCEKQLDGSSLLAKNKQKSIVKSLLLVLVCNVPQCQFSRTFNYCSYVLLIFKAFSSLFVFSPKLKDFQVLSRTIRPPPAWSVKRRQTESEITYMPRIGIYVSTICRNISRRLQLARIFQLSQ